MDWLSYLFLTLPFALAILLALSIVFLGIAMLHRPGPGLFLFAIAVLQPILLPGAPALPVGVRLYFGDLVTLTMFVAGAIRYATDLTPNRLPRVLLPFAVIALLSFGLGLMKYQATAGVAFRPYFYCFAVALYFGSFRYREELLQAALSCLTFLGLLMMLLAGLRWAGVMHGEADTVRAPENEFSGLNRLRAINSVSTMILLEFALALMLCNQVSKLVNRLRWLPPVVLTMVLVLQHRSVWVAAFAGLAAMYVLGNRPKQNALYYLAGFAFAGALVIAVLTTEAGSNITGTIAKSADRAISGADTGQARVETWTFVLNKVVDGGPLVWLLGLPFGTSMERSTLSSSGAVHTIAFYAHNMFVQTLFNTGLLGVLSLLALLLWLALNAHRRLVQASDRGTHALPLVLLASLVAFYFFYGIDLVDGLIFGLLFSATGSQEASKSPSITQQTLHKPALDSRSRQRRSGESGQSALLSGQPNHPGPGGPP